MDDYTIFSVVRRPQLQDFVARTQLTAGLATPNDRLSIAVLNWLAETARGWPNKATKCLVCEGPFSHSLPESFVLVETSPRPDALTITGVCQPCAQMTDRELIDEAAVLLGLDPRETEELFAGGGVLTLH